MGECWDLLRRREQERALIHRERGRESSQVAELDAASERKSRVIASEWKSSDRVGEEEVS
jgi:hypothetical protein